ncbi:LAGLIDADG family homing endonuclease [Candidatus Pacearchaeota archaeon]|nr:LAGLIDADG family homing endonuclease [Candidatus Pacearchaeota archaeon]
MKRGQFIYYLLGFTDGEGCFCIAIKNQKSAKMRWVLDPVFHITQHERNKEILYNFKKFLGCGEVIKKYGQEDTLIFLVHRRKDLIDKIIPFFKKNKLIVKGKTFELFAQVVESLDKHAHGNIKDFKKLLKKVFLMNGEGRYRKYKLEDILKSLGSSETIRQTLSKRK